MACGLSIGVGSLHLVRPLPVMASAETLAVQPYDFDRDGRQEIVATGLAERGPLRRGAAMVLTPTEGSRTLRAAFITRSSLGIAQKLSPGSLFWPAALASADFDGDSYADLAIGSYYFGDKDEPRTADGAVAVSFGSAAGLDPVRRQLIVNAATSDETVTYGRTVVAGDLDGDGFADLVVGLPQFGPLGSGRPETTGAIEIVFGGPDGLRAETKRRLEPPVGSGFFFAFNLALGDVTGDGYRDVAVGGGSDALWLCPGGPTGPTSCSVTRVPRDPRSLAVGDLDADGYADIVAGYDQLTEGPGAVRVWRGGPLGPISPPLTITQNSPAVPGSNERSDMFGEQLDVGDIDHDGFDDLAVGASGENGFAGRVTIIRGGPSLIANSGHTFLSQRTKGIPGRRRPGHQFGQALALLDTTGDGRLDLTIRAQQLIVNVRSGHRGLATPSARALSGEPRTYLRHIGRAGASSWDG